MSAAMPSSASSSGNLRPADPVSELGAFRSEVRALLAQHLPDELRVRASARRHLGKQDYIAWQQLLDDRGWFVGHWPSEYGGHEWGRLKRWVFEQELDLAGAPWLIPFGITYVGPVLYAFGTPEQRLRYLPAIKRSTEWWAQGYSEPGAGSDLANIATRAVRDGDHYVVSGQKAWTSYAHWADRMFTLVRTSNEGSPQRGVSFLLIDMTSPGVTVRPTATFDGSHHVNEIFLDEVRVPVADLIGEEGKGWGYAKFLLGNERFLAAEVGKAKRMLADFGIAVRTLPDGPARTRWDWRLRELSVEIVATEAAAVALLKEADRGAEVSTVASMLKLLGSELLQKIASATLDMMDGSGLSIERDDWPDGSPGAGPVREYLFGRVATIYGGSSEIQRNILTRALGL